MSLVLVGACCLGACGGTSGQDQPQVSATSCTVEATTFWKSGSEVRQYFTDHRGRDVELRCERGFLSAHWDLRAGWDERVDDHGGSGGAAAVDVHQSMTIGGCYFYNGDNVGPTVSEGPDHRITKVTWINQDPGNDHAKYEFVFDFATGEVTITASTPGSTPVTRVVRPQESWEKLHALLPDPWRSVTASGS